jgi:hypothetical protein
MNSQAVQLATRVSNLIDGELLDDIVVVMTSILAFAIGSGGGTLEDKEEVLERAIEILRARMPQAHAEEHWE